MEKILNFQKSGYDLDLQIFKRVLCYRFWTSFDRQKNENLLIQMFKIKEGGINLIFKPNYKKKKKGLNFYGGILN